ncbi:MAG: hypothetical protein JO295_03420 [Verrucomicrobia bacterium]|nr:hypothetical protein [Verrucomicrobiota bacterium]
MKTLIPRVPVLFSQALPLFLCAVCALLLSACANTQQSRAKDRPAAFKRLSPGDQQLVLNGQLRDGLDKDAVYIAWGAPDRVFEGRHSGHPFESWVYLTQRTAVVNTGPFYYGPYLGLYPGVGYVRGGRRGFAYFGGYYDPAFLYGPQFATTLVPYKKAVFVDGRLQTFEVLRNDSH